MINNNENSENQNNIGPCVNSLESSVVSELSPAGKIEGKNPPTFIIEITDFRHRLLDVDGPCLKYVIDALKFSNVIPQDGPKQIRKIILNQIQIKNDNQERTEIEITKLED